MFFKVHIWKSKILTFFKEMKKHLSYLAHQGENVQFGVETEK